MMDANERAKEMKEVCLICGVSTKHLEGSVFCSRSCENKAMTKNTGTVAQRLVRERMQGNPNYRLGRFVDGGFWPGQNHDTKMRNRRKEWKEMF